MKKVLLLATVVALAFALPALAYKSGNLEASDRMTLSVTDRGAVDFDHTLHTEKVSDCKTCHHYGVGNGSCRDCHGRSNKASSMADALKANCLKCHPAAAESTTEPNRKEKKRKR